MLDLTGLVSGGDDLEVRFDFGKDGCTGVTGWYVDDFEVYICVDCATNIDCRDSDVCTCDQCMPGGSCDNAALGYGNVNCAGPPGQTNLDDVLCVLNGFANIVNCPNGDISPACTGNNIINLDDILAVLSALGGANPCGCSP